MSDISAVTFGLQAFVTLLVILDPPGATPIFLGVLGNRTRAQRTLLAWQAAATSLFVITLFALFGQFIVNYLDISMPALQGAGGLLNHSRVRRYAASKSCRFVDCGHCI